jgi:DNA-binding response OmpR family regulator
MPEPTDILGKVLIAEDEKALSRALQLKFSQAGFIAEVADDGEEALTLLRNGHFDVLLLDIMMPHKNGFEVLETMKAEGIKTHTFVLSNLSQTEDKARAESLGAAGFFVKANVPISLILGQVKQFYTQASGKA